MTLVVPLILIAAQQGSQATSSDSSVQKVGPAAAKAAAPQALYRKDAVFVAWDARGLTIRNGEKKHTTRLPEVSLTPKLFSKDEIIKTKELMKEDVRSKYASGLSGSKRVGDQIYFLPRWTDNAGSTWLEALILVDLGQLDPKEKLVGKFDGLTPAAKPIDDKLFVSNATVCAITRKADDYGLSSYDPKTGKFAYKSLGKGLISDWQIGPSTFLVQEKTSYGSRVLTRIDIETGSRRDLAETRGSISLLDYSKPYLVRLTRPEGEMLRNIDTGAEVLLPKNPVIKRTAKGVEISSKDDPKTVTLYDPVKFEKIKGK